MKEIGLILDTRRSRQQYSTGSGNETGSKPEDETHTRFLFIQILVFRKLLMMSAVKTDVNPSDVGTKALGRDRLCRMRAVLGLDNDFAETCSLGN